MIARYGRELSWGATVVAFLLWFAAVVVYFRGDLGEPIVAAGTFAAVGLLVWLAGRLVGILAERRLPR